VENPLLSAFLRRVLREIVTGDLIDWTVRVLLLVPALFVVWFIFDTHTAGMFLFYAVAGFIAAFLVWSFFVWPVIVLPAALLLKFVITFPRFSGVSAAIILIAVLVKLYG
jgi:hypothetical protein